MHFTWTHRLNSFSQPAGTPILIYARYHIHTKTVRDPLSNHSKHQPQSVYQGNISRLDSLHYHAPLRRLQRTARSQNPIWYLAPASSTPINTNALTLTWFCSHQGKQTDIYIPARIDPVDRLMQNRSNHSAKAKDKNKYV